MNRYSSSLGTGALILLPIIGCGDREDRPGVYDLAAQETAALHSAAAAAEPRDGHASGRVFETEHMWDAKVTIAEGIMLGESKRGWRRIVPITGGTFAGPNIRGEVVPGGEDWQLTRPDGDTELYARYLLRTHDGHLIQVINRVLMHFPPGGDSAYIRSVIDLEAPVGSPYEYLNHAIFLGTLDQPALEPGEEPYVVIGVYRVL
jgi:hypothetical protein